MNRPTPQTVALDVDTTELAAYADIASAVGFTPVDLQMLRLRIFLKQVGIPVYDPVVVRDWILLQAKRQGKVWGWYPLRPADVGARCLEEPYRVYDPMGLHHGYIAAQPYTHLVPGIVLGTVQKIATAFPEAHFFVSDYAVPTPDPFLAVGFTGSPLIVVDFWDEPGFRPLSGKTDS